ncbi:glycoside hydrolase family 53 protein [Cellulomonas humilata]|uniref:Arabinogalactan endo-beta-1,4-galactanase n=1 Tax=Cellulomonas humilata TaxID=144055 RepID=A0ABU0EBL7_9CELL|nr:glycosyl hydrolase 53 family protein [Cellulomonas humilata]MDQ0372660.1 arabinogalactan endo-1,4-beta-galactosidase [Cellulomonas humilata]
MNTRRRITAMGIATVLTAVALAVPSPVQAANSLSMLGGDLSSLQRSLDLGVKYYDANGSQKHPLDILKGAGMNYARLRVWNNPASGYNNAAKVTAYAKEVKARGLKLMVDLHYSDTWADPGNQWKPAAWANHGIQQLQKDVYDYTYGVCTTLKAQGTTPDSIQIGNEINVGMLWNEGKVANNSFANLGLLLKSGYNAVKACSASTQVIIHTANSDSTAHLTWFYDGIRNQGVTWDITGLSYYCFWHGGLDALYSAVSTARTRYGKPVVLVETAYPFTTANADFQANSANGTCAGFDASWTSQATMFQYIQNTVRNAGGIGVFYWEPTWTAVQGNGWDPYNMNGTGDGWDNMAVFSWSGRVNPGIRWTP